jgi:hypoxanthine phosphoribosyltransferase
MDGMWRRLGPYGLTWPDLGVLLDRIAAGIRADGFAPDVVCPVARGGLVAGGYLATVLDLPKLHVVRVRRTTSDDRYADKQPAVLDVVAPATLGPDSTVLVVDDIVGTGATAELVERHLAEYGVQEVRTAALVRNHRSAFQPRYCPLVVDDWVVFPWEAAPDTTELRRLDPGR